MDADSFRYIKNLRDVKERIKARLGIRTKVRHKSLRAASAATVASSIVATRVFKGNVILDRFTRSLSAWSLNETGSNLGEEKAGKWRTYLKQKSTAAKSFVAQKLSAAPTNELFFSQGDSAVALGERKLNSLGGFSSQSQNSEVQMDNSEKKLKDEKSSKALTMESILDEDNNDPSSLALKLFQSFTIPILGNVCHVFMHGFNKTQVFGADKLIQAVNDRPLNQPLITVCNHVAALDDPLVLSAILHPSMMINSNKMRWTMCATDRCFTNSVMSAFFHSVKVLPLERGAGVHQKGMDKAIRKLNNGEWVHIFPEGSRSRDGGKSITQIKRGIGRLVAECDQVPLILPFIHSGMENVLGVGTKIPRIGKTVSVMVGDPIEVNDIFDQFRLNRMSENELYDAIASRVSKNMIQLKKRLEVELENMENLEKSYLNDVGNNYDGSKYESLYVESADPSMQFIDWSNQKVFQIQPSAGNIKNTSPTSSSFPSTSLQSDTSAFHSVLDAEAANTNYTSKGDKIRVGLHPSVSPWHDDTRNASRFFEDDIHESGSATNYHRNHHHRPYHASHLYESTLPKHRGFPQLNRLLKLNDDKGGLNDVILKWNYLKSCAFQEFTSSIGFAARTWFYQNEYARVN